MQKGQIAKDSVFGAASDVFEPKYHMESVQE